MAQFNNGTTWRCTNVFEAFIFEGEVKQKPQTTFKDHLVFAEAWCLLALARLILLFVPFKKIIPLLKYKRVKALPEAQRLNTLRTIQLAIARACIRSPWRTKCFEQALAAKMMTRRRGLDSITYFGVKNNNNEKMQAHAWLKCGEFVVTGWQKMQQYIIIGEF